MNMPRRKRLREITEQLEALKSELEDVLSEEEESRDNIPENLWGSERYERAEECCDQLSSAVDAIDECLEAVGAAVE